MNGTAPKTITKEAPLNVQSNANTYAAGMELESAVDPIDLEFYYRTTSGHRSPHLQIYSMKVGRKGKKLSYSFGFILLDYPVATEEKLTLGCIFTFPSK